jgi:hypothetical protein
MFMTEMPAAQLLGAMLSLLGTSTWMRPPRVGMQRVSITCNASSFLLAKLNNGCWVVSRYQVWIVNILFLAKQHSKARLFEDSQLISAEAHSWMLQSSGYRLTNVSFIRKYKI